MSVQAISGSANPYPSAVQSTSATMSSELKNLISAIQSGDLKGAQNAFSEIQGLLGGTQTSQAVTAATASGQQNQMSADFTALGNALQSGNMNAAQDALKKLVQDAQSTGSTGKAHRHHHHHGGKPPSDATATAVSSTSATSESTTSNGTSLNVLV